MGYFGGWFDLVVQRVIEILSNIPFLFLVIIITLGVPAQYKDRLGFLSYPRHLSHFWLDGNDLPNANFSS